MVITDMYLWPCTSADGMVVVLPLGCPRGLEDLPCLRNLLRSAFATSILEFALSGLNNLLEVVLFLNEGHNEAVIGLGGRVGRGRQRLVGGGGCARCSCRFLSNPCCLLRSLPVQGREAFFSLPLGSLLLLFEGLFALVLVDGRVKGVGVAFASILILLMSRYVINNVCIMNISLKRNLTSE